MAVEDTAVTVTRGGYLKRTSVDTYRRQTRGGKGRIGMGTRTEDFVEHLIIASTHAYLLIFTTRGRVYWLKAYEIPDATTTGKGRRAPVRTSSTCAGSGRKEIDAQLECAQAELLGNARGQHALHGDVDVGILAAKSVDGRQQVHAGVLVGRQLQMAALQALQFVEGARRPRGAGPAGGSA